MSKSNKYRGDGTAKPVYHVSYFYEPDGIVFTDQDGSHPFKLSACCLKHGKATINGFEEAFNQLDDHQKQRFDGSILDFGKFVTDHIEAREFFWFPVSVHEYWSYQPGGELYDLLQ